MEDRRPAIVFSIFGTSTGDIDIAGNGDGDNAFYGVFFSAEEALAAIRTECRLLVPTGMLWYRFYVYRGMTGDRACIEQDDVRSLGGRDPNALDAFYVQFYWKDWLPEGIEARRDIL